MANPRLHRRHIYISTMVHLQNRLIIDWKKTGQGSGPTGNKIYCRHSNSRSFVNNRRWILPQMSKSSDNAIQFVFRTKKDPDTNLLNCPKEHPSAILTRMIVKGNTDTSGLVSGLVTIRSGDCGAKFKPGYFLVCIKNCIRILSLSFQDLEDFQSG